MSGRHVHHVADGTTAADGAHAHVVVLDGIPLPTLPGGEHLHALGPDGRTPEDGAHAHEVLAPNGDRLWTRVGGPHRHVAVNGVTAEGGEHAHEVEVAGQVYTTDTPEPTPRAVEREIAPLAKRVPQVREVSPGLLRTLSADELRELDDALHAAAEALP